MAKYVYRAFDTDNKTHQGEIEAETLEEARKKVKLKGYTPIEINLESRRKGVKHNKGFSSKEWIGSVKLSREKYLNGEDLGNFCRQFAVIMDSGISTIIGLNVLEKQSVNKKLKSEVSRLRIRIEAGMTVSDAMAEKGSLFPPILAAMIKAGEATGKIDIVLRSMADYYEKDSNLKKKVKSAAIYPSIVLGMAFLLIIFFMKFILPNVINVINSAGGELFWLTKVIIVLTNVVNNYFVLLLLMIVSLVLLCASFLKTEKGVRMKDRAILKIPYIGQVERNIVSLRFSLAMNVFTLSGFSILQGLALLKDIVGNKLAEDSIKQAIRGLQRGESLSENLMRNKFFDSIVVEMIAIGEETGKLQSMTEKLSDFYEREVDVGINKLLAMAEPLLMLFVGLIVGTLIIAVALPMMTIFTNF